MHLQIVSGQTGRVRQLDLREDRTLLIGAVAIVLFVTAIFYSGMQLGRFIAGPMQGERMMRDLAEQGIAIDATRHQLQGKVDALAKRVGTLNAHLIRLDALGRRITDLADLDRGEFNFDEPPPTGGNTSIASLSRSAVSSPSAVRALSDGDGRQTRPSSSRSGKRASVENVSASTPRRPRTVRPPLSFEGA